MSFQSKLMFIAATIVIFFGFFVPYAQGVIADATTNCAALEGASTLVEVMEVGEYTTPCTQVDGQMVAKSKVPWISGMQTLLQAFGIGEYAPPCSTNATVEEVQQFENCTR